LPTGQWLDFDYDYDHDHDQKQNGIETSTSLRSGRDPKIGRVCDFGGGFIIAAEAAPTKSAVR
jgi:hypothetical protein